MFSVSNENSTSGPFNKGGIADLSLLRTLTGIRQKSWQPSLWKVMDSFLLLPYTSLATSRALSQQLLDCINFPLDLGDWRWVRPDLTYAMIYVYVSVICICIHIYICISFNPNPVTKLTSSSRSTEFSDKLPWNVSQMIMKTVPISTRIVISYAMKRGVPWWIWWKFNWNWDKNMIRIAQWKKKKEIKPNEQECEN